MIEIIEQTHLKHFEYLPKKLGFRIEKKNGLSLINCHNNSSWFNIAFGAISTPTANSVQEIVESFERQPFAWWIPPSQSNPILTELLHKLGFVQEASEEAMVCDLKELEDFSFKTNLELKQVSDHKSLESFLSVLDDYDKTTRKIYSLLPDDFASLPEKLFVGQTEGKTSVVAILHCGELATGIFGLITTEESRGKGFGSDMMKHLLNFAKKNGARYSTLSASSDSGYKIYESLGFKKVGAFECFEYKE